MEDLFELASGNVMVNGLSFQEALQEKGFSFFLQKHYFYNI